MKQLKYKKKILVLSTNRSDYGLLKNLILELKKKEIFIVKLVVSGSHLIKNYGNTINEIRKDKIDVFKKIKIKYSDDTPTGVSKFNLEILNKFNELLSTNKFDIVIVLGDRTETLFCSALSLIYNVKLAHIHGGEVTKGAIDNEIRNAISQISNIHFVSHKEYKKNLIKLGINRNKIYVVGGLGASAIQKSKTLSKKKLEKKFKIKLNKKYLLVTYHPVTSKKYSSNTEFLNLMSCLNQFDDTIKIITSPNIDSNNFEITKIINYFVKNFNNFYFYQSLGSLNYLSFLKYSDGVVGNSSSGILEAPSFKIPTLNVGNRQLGRLHSNSILNVSNNKKNIIYALNKILKDERFKIKLKKTKNIYYQQGTEKKIIKELLKI